MYEQRKMTLTDRQGVTAALQRFLDEQIENGSSAGLQGVVFDRDGIVFEGASGKLRPAEQHRGTEAEPMQTNSIQWLASNTKLVISLIVLRLLEQDKHGFSLGQLDDHDALIRVLPEFDLQGDHVVTKIITGFTEDVDDEGKHTPLYKKATNKVTLRQLLTHSIGGSYAWNSSLMKEWFDPSDQSRPQTDRPGATGNVRDFGVPQIRDGGKLYDYCMGTDWVGQFIVRLSRQNLRANFIEHVVTPLQGDISLEDIDMMLSFIVSHDGATERLAGFSIRSDTGAGRGFRSVPIRRYEPPTPDPPHGKAHYASACMYATLPSYSRILRAVLVHDKRLLKEDTWKLAESDNATPYGVHVPFPNMKSFDDSFGLPIDHYFDISKETDKPQATNEQGDPVDLRTGVNLFQALVTLVPTNNGLSAQAFSWAGLGNQYWFIDPAKGVGAIIGGQLLPFYDEQIVQTRFAWEKLVSSSFP